MRESLRSPTWFMDNAQSDTSDIVIRFLPIRGLRSRSSPSQPSIPTTYSCVICKKGPPEKRGKNDNIPEEELTNPIVRMIWNGELFAFWFLAK